MLVACLAACQVQVSGDREAGAAVRAEVENYYLDLSARDWVAFADHFWPDATLTTAWQPPGEDAVRVVATTVPEFVAKAPDGPDSAEVFEEWPTGMKVRIAGSLAQVWASYSARFGDPGQIVEWSGIDAMTLLRHEGRWRIVSIAYASEF